MFKIREEQYGIFSQEQKIKFRDKLYSSLIRDFPETEYGLSPQEIEARMDKALMDAPARGMITEPEYIKYTYIVVAIGPGLETNAEYKWVNDVLLSRQSGAEKLNMIESHINPGMQ